MELFIVRHGETLWNKDRRLQGSTDISLSDKGRELAVKTGQALRDVTIDRIYSSPLSRAYETACLIRGERNIEIVTDERLKEICFGDLEGQVMDELSANPKSSFKYFFDAPEKYVPDKNGEALLHLCKRTAEFMEQVILPQADTAERIMIVGHGAMNKSIMCFIKKHGIDKFWSGGLQKNCNVIIVRYSDGKFQVLEEEKTFY